MTANPASITIPTLLSADEFATLHSHHRMELVKGYPKILPIPGAQHEKVCMTIGRLIGNHVADNDLGHVMGNDTFIQTGTNPDSVRGADVLFIPYDRLPRDQVPPGVLRVVPTVVIEVRSPSDRWPDTVIKVGEYLNIGVGAVLVLDVPTRTVSIFRDQDQWQQILEPEAELTLPDLLPGFAVSVRKLFE